MLQKSFNAPLHEISHCARQVFDTLSPVVERADPARTVIFLAEIHYEMAQSLFQIGFLDALHRQIRFDSFVELEKDDLFARDMPGQPIWEARFPAAVRYVHRNCLYPMVSCLTPAYILSNIEPELVCNDMVGLDDVAAESEAMVAQRNLFMAQALLDRQAAHGRPVMQICGQDHLWDEEYRDSATLLDLLDDKDIIVLHLHAGSNAALHSRQKSRKLHNINARGQTHILADIDVTLPSSLAWGDSRLFNRWDKMALANDAPALLLSQRARQAQRRTP